MRLLFDEHLSPKLVQMLGDVYPDSINVLTIDYGGVSDDEILEYAILL